jgi:hypothetical protein
MSGISRRYIVLGSILVVTLWLWLALDKQYSPAHIVWSVYNEGPTGQMGVTQRMDVFNFPPVKSQAIRDVCATTDWNSSLVFTCDNNHGGIGHVRNSILNCVRYAMAAGGSLVMPSIALREDDEMGSTHVEDHDEMEETHSHIDKRHGYGRQGMEYMFDKNHFVESLRLSCPEMTLIRDMEGSITDRRRGLLPESLFQNVPTSGIEHPDQWPMKLDAWIDKNMARYPKEEPIIIDLEQSFLHYPTDSDGHAFAHSFGNILKFRSDVRRLATKILHEMADWYEMPMNLSQPIIVPSYFAAHLDTASPYLEERHVTDPLYSHFQAQTSAYLEHASSAHLKLMYVASGNVQDIHKLSLQAADFGVSVTHKEDLLKGSDFEQMEGLRWDQRALVDYLVLLKAQEFAGVGHSPFSWQVAMTRHEHGDKSRGKLEREVYTDGLSTLYGVRYDYVESSFCMWS